MINLPRSIERIQSLSLKSEKNFLVGGAIRDALLSCSSHDLDIVCSNDPRILARKLADQISGSFFMLDEERNACRVIGKDADGKQTIFDFTQMRGESIQADLLERDFTINAMAVDLANPGEVIDPLRGGRDLVEKWLRLCKDTSFLDDPLRVIRAIRYSVRYGLKIEPRTIKSLKQAVKSLVSVSRERKRDELFKILDNAKAWTAIGLLAHFKVLPFIGLIDIPDIGKALTRLKVFSRFTSCLTNDKQSASNDAFLMASFMMSLKQHRQFLSDHLIEVNQSDRSTKSLDGLAALLWDIDYQDIQKLADELAISKDERLHLSSILTNKTRVLELLLSITEVDNRKIYRYFQSMGCSGVDLALLTMAENVSTLSADLKGNSWITLLELSQRLINSWYTHPEVVNPRLLLTGNDLMFEFDLIQGLIIGQILEQLKEEQAAGLIQTREEALAWVESQIRPEMFLK